MSLSGCGGPEWVRCPLVGAVVLSGCGGPEWVRCPLVGAVVLSGCGLVGVSLGEGGSSHLHHTDPLAGHAP